MTVSSVLNKQIFPGNGAITTFNFTFAFPGGTASQESANIQVFLTDTLGNITLLSPTVYSITFNPATGTNPTPVGGVVTYPLVGSPIPSGSFLTILRTLPLTQSTSLANQGTLFQPVVESSLDYEMMISQQVLEIQSRALVVSVSDPTPSPIPAVAARANLFFAWDASGNPIASQPGGANTPISTAMVPVVTAATLAAGRAAFGLGTLATVNAGTGITISGSNASPSFTEVTDAAGPISIGNAQHMNVRVATVPNLTYNLAQTSTLIAGFSITIQAEGGMAILAPNAGDAFNGMSAGVSFVVPEGAAVTLATNNTGTWYISNTLLEGMNAPLNTSIGASVATSALTIALTDTQGNNPSASAPTIFATCNGQGGLVQRAVIGPLSITVPNGATLGTVNGQTSRIWVGLFDNAGTPVLGVYNSLSGTNVLPWDETSAPSTTAISAGATLAQTWYTNGALTSKNFRILGYVESTQPTAGAWTVAPSKVQLFGPGQKKPGDIVQTQNVKVGAAATTSSLTFVALTGESITIPVQSAADLIEVQANGTLAASAITTAQPSVSLSLSRGTVANTNLIGNQATASVGVNNTALTVPSTLLGYDLPNTAGSVTYAVQGSISNAAGTLTYGGFTQLAAREIFV